MDMKRRLFAIALTISALFSTAGCCDNNNSDDDNRCQSTQNIVINRELQFINIPKTYPENLNLDNEDLQQLEFLYGKQNSNLCTYQFDGDSSDFLNQISYNTENYLKKHPEFINALSPNLNSSEYPISEISNYLYEITYFVVSSLINGDYSNDNHSDLCNLSSLKIVLSTDLNIEGLDIITGQYDDKENAIILFLGSIIPMSSYLDIPLEQYIQSILLHEFNHLRQKPCVHCGGSIMSYDEHLVCGLTESSAESAIFFEKPTKNLSLNDYEYSDYFFESSFERLLMIVGSFTNDSRDDYYKAVFDNNIDGIFDFLSASSTDEKLTIISSLRDFDGVIGRNDLADCIENQTLSTGSNSDIIGVGYILELQKMAYQRLIDYADINHISSEYFSFLKQIIDDEFDKFIKDYGPYDLEFYNHYLLQMGFALDNYSDKCLSGNGLTGGTMQLQQTTRYNEVIKKLMLKRTERECPLLVENSSISLHF